jgi:fructokinase
VGAGDAFLSALLSGLLAGRGGPPLLDRANRLGAYVASHSGALPAYEIDGLDDIDHLPLPE